MTDISKEEVDLMNESLEKDINNLGETMRVHREDVRDDFKSVWKAIDGMLLKIGGVVTVMTTVVLFIFKIVESTGAQ